MEINILSLPMIINCLQMDDLSGWESASAENIWEKIFEPLYSGEGGCPRSYIGGTGLGMSIAKALFEQMGVPLRFPVLRVSVLL